MRLNDGLPAKPAIPSDAEVAMLRSFGLSAGQYETVLEAHREAPKGLIVVALDSRRFGNARGNSGAGLLMRRVARGDHYDEEIALERPSSPGPRPTGWRYARGTHGETWVRDPLGTDVPPRNYSSG